MSLLQPMFTMLYVLIYSTQAYFGVGLGAGGETVPAFGNFKISQT